MGERGIFCSLLRDKKSGVFGTLKVLLKDNVSTNYVADCRYLYPEERKEVRFANDSALLTLSWSRSNSVCFAIFSVTALLVIGKKGSKGSVERMVFR